MKAHVGADAENGLVRSVIGTAANVADLTKAHELLHGGAMPGYIGVEQRLEHQGRVEWQVAMKPGKQRALGKTEAGRLRERNRASQGARSALAASMPSG